MMIESRLHNHNAFATLTFNEKNVPWEVTLEEHQTFIRELRRVYPAPIRYFGVGEYGDKSLRPHYHYALFGMSFLDEAYVLKAWDKGFVQLVELSPDLCSYLAGYVSKKMTKKDDPRLEGRNPEFARMSLRPGLGGDAGDVFAKSLYTGGVINNLVDVPHQYNIGRKSYPMSNYVRKQIRKALGWEHTEPQLAKQGRYYEWMSMSDQDKEVREIRREKSNLSAISRLKIWNSKKVI